MDVSFRHFSQREGRRHRCPCPQCGNLIYRCPFRFRYQHSGPLPVFALACEQPVVAQQLDPARCNPEEYRRVVTALNSEYRACLSTTTIGEVLAKTSKRLGTTYKSWYVSPAVCQAAQRALAAYAHAERNPSAAARGAQEALAISNVCPDAYALLARFRAKTLQEALELYERGAQDLEKILSAEGCTRTVTAYGITVVSAPPYMGVARCMEGVIYTLCRMRRAEEAYAKLVAMLRISPPIKEDPAHSVWVIAPEVVYRARGPAQCLSWMNAHLCDEVFDWGGGEVWWLATYALAWTATHKGEGFKWSDLRPDRDETTLGGRCGGSEDSDYDEDDEEFSDDDDEEGGGKGLRSWRSTSDKLRSGLALAACCCWLPMMVDMLLGDMPVPAGPLPPMTVAAGSVGAQVAYVRYCGDLWRDTPGVLDHVRRYRNTYEVFGIIADARAGNKPNMREFRRYMGLTPAPSAPAKTSASTPSTPAGSTPTTASSSGSVVQRRGSTAAIFTEAIKYEGGFAWHGLVDLATAFTSHLLEQPDPTMDADDFEILRSLLAAGCPIRPANTPRTRQSYRYAPLLIAMYRGYGPDVIRELVKAGADPLRAGGASSIPVLSAAEQGMWRELQAVFKIKRKLGFMPVPFLGGEWMARYTCDVTGMPSTVFELALLVAFNSECLACVSGFSKNGCTRCKSCKDNGGSASPHGPWSNFSKVVEVLVAYGMTSVSGPLRRWMGTQAKLAPTVQVRNAQTKILEDLDRLLLEVKERQQGGQQQAPAEAEVKTADKKQEEQRGKGQAVGQKGELTGGGKTAGGGAVRQGQEKDKQDTQLATAAPPPVPAEPAALQKQEQQGAKQVSGSGASKVSLPQQQQGSESTAAAQNGQVGVAGSKKRSKSSRAAVGNSASGAANTGATAKAATAATPAAASTPEPTAAATISVPPALCLEPHQDGKHCWCCGKAKDRAAGVKMRKCSKCLTARYCGEGCQREHWPSHRQQCGLLAAQTQQ